MSKYKDKSRIEWENSHISKMTPHVENLCNVLKEYKISFIPNDGVLDNVIFSKEGFKDLKIAHECFYRFSGFCMIFKETYKAKKVNFEVIPVDDDMFINSYMCSLILMYFKTN